MNRLQERLYALSPAELGGLARGIEKESLRARPDATLADTPHPPALGSALTHPNITTDFSESQLELITGVHADACACLGELTEIHQVVHRGIGDELLWASSMPCVLPADDLIPIGQYGSSNVGRAKTVYRHGLSWRYGRRMQTISGIHYNFSLPPSAWAVLGAAADERSARERQTAGYFGLIRNFRRHSWLLLYLFGASPAVCRSFLDDRPHGLQPLGEGTLYLPHATSLRMGPLGYQSDAQASLAVSFNGLDGYSASLSRALSEAYPAYEKIGVRGPDGSYRQLATSLLQIENEFYGTIRPKRTIRTGERPLRALAERGVEYVEVRCMDLDPFSPIGIEPGVLRFLDVFLLHCLLCHSPPDSPAEIAAMSRNQHLVAQRGREPGLVLQRGDASLPLADWGRALLDECAPIAEALDAAAGAGGTPHRDALAEAARLLAEPERTPSARVLDEITGRHGNSFVAFTLARSQAHRRALEELALPAQVQARHERMAAASFEEQRRIEAADRMPFEEYRQRYIAGELGRPD